MKSLKRSLTAGLVVLNLILIFGGYSKDGKMYQWVGQHLADMMTYIAQMIGGVNAVGWAVITITAIFRIILLPFMLNQQANTTVNQIKMQALKPELAKAQEIAKNATDPVQQQKASLAMMTLYRENGVSMTGGISWLTMLLQIPIFSGIYSAILHTPSLREATFFGINLNSTSILLAVLAGAVYFAQAQLSLRYVPEEQKQMTRPMMLLIPGMMVAVTLFTNASLGLYFVVGGLFALLQTIINHYQRPSLEKKAAEGFKIKVTADDLFADQNPASAKDVTATATQSDVKPRNRNAGKQKRQ
jgi:YidC/Oxa1 family membrane protein insertase